MEVFQERRVELHHPNKEVVRTDSFEIECCTISACDVVRILACVDRFKVEIQGSERVVGKTWGRWFRVRNEFWEHRCSDITNRDFFFPIPKCKNAGTVSLDNIGAVDGKAFTEREPFLPVRNIAFLGNLKGRVCKMGRHIVLPWPIPILLASSHGLFCGNIVPAVHLLI